MDHLQSMKVFVRVADLGSFARAAGAMDISNAVATRHIADLKGVSAPACSTAPRAACR